jgi:DNA-directed RNA polymerase subunit E'/Rpb7
MQHIPADMEFTAADESFTSLETGVKVQRGSSVRIKVIGASIIETSLCAIGTINEPHLGLLTL